MRTSRFSLWSFLAGSALLAACSSDSSAPAEPVPVTLRFAAVAGSQDLRCGSTYAGLGTTNSTISLTDFKAYVHNVRLLRADGSEEPVSLTQDGTWQLDGIAMLDFEDATGSCSNGTPATRTVIEGTAAPGTYTGVRFTLGLPFSRNHADVTTAPSPLNQSRMFWNWNGGYKFLRLDVNTTGRPTGWFVHLGSTGCNGATATTAPTSCAQPNRAEVTLTGFNPLTGTIALDVAQLYAQSDLNSDAGGPVGCMSGTADPECQQILPRLGLPWNTTPAAAQVFFRVR